MNWVFLPIARVAFGLEDTLYFVLGVDAICISETPVPELLMLLGNTKPAIGQWFVGNTDFCRMVPLLFIRVHRDWESFVRSKPGFWETSGCKVSGSYIPPQNQSIIHISAVKKHDRLKEWRVLTVFAGVYERDIFLHLSSIHCATLCNEFAEKKLVAKRRFDCPPSSSTPQNCITMAVIGIQKSQN